MLQNFEHVMKPDVSYTTLAKLIAFWLKKIPSAITVPLLIKCFKISLVMKEYRHHSDVKSTRPTCVGPGNGEIYEVDFSFDSLEILSSTETRVTN